ncbi:TetR/AcrR family transcriptional regulator [Methanobacterium sp.]|uniref:TetR/AcrR family transcriptional regulator n=1 Tax=Methanobacterium sp. TaxID=2164 RepID=UPI0025ECE140|nr:TetR/AcrR family transcriptional regulator [Methanobacterium sp.]MBI5460288.1 TetR/AcrR family transcriptional regulator [Methanobacterium sp.]
MISRMERKKAQNKRLILDATEKLIAEKGIGQLTMNKVAEEVDFAIGTIYLYFNTKESLFAAIYARINKEINQAIKNKMDLYQTGSEKVVATGTALMEFTISNPQKWKVGIELYHEQFEDAQDPNVQYLLQAVNEMIHMLADAYQQGIDEGSIHADLDPVSAAIFSRMAFINAFALNSEQKMLLELNKISPKRYHSFAWNLINRSTHIKPSLREESDMPLEDHRSEEDIRKEIKTMIDSLGLPAEDAMQIRDAWLMLTQIMMGGVEHEPIENTPNRVTENVTLCPAFNSFKETGTSPDKNIMEGCPRYCTILVETLNPQYIPRFKKKLCAGDAYCEIVIELKDDLS